MSQSLRTIMTPSGAKFTVAAEHADRFQGLLNDLEARGYKIDPGQSGGYNPRNIAGTNTPSLHSFGRAIDINWNENARGKPGSIPQDVALELAGKHGLTWGGTWKNRDDMHFEAPWQDRPMQARSLVAAAGLTDGAPKQPQTQTPASAPLTGSQQGMGMLADTFDANESVSGGDVFKAVLGGMGGMGLDLSQVPQAKVNLQMVEAKAPQVDMSRLSQAVRRKKWGV
jgi:hypothetical protein